ncbi:flavodoxin domain-containing protein [Hydrogenoanaerobacterium sp.]|uniref:flavodoxin domain-containing protein n=1 Tax=Hydrogenoanaerobacterium sp. TaxID=2953763 RepID=UPI002898E847|nr:flavodoxin domain-containing protein [Hydrogenoanaerobacterium sp.]
MKNAVVVYQSKYGSTKKYAQWLAERLDCELFKASQIKADRLEQYDTILFGGGLYASGISGISLITNHFEKLKGKTIAVFTVGLADPNQKEQFGTILERNFTEEMRSQIRIFHLRGGIDYKKLGFIHKTMMKMLINMMRKRPQEELTEEQNMMLEAYGRVVDFTDQTTIEPIVSFVKAPAADTQ